MERRMVTITLLDFESGDIEIDGCEPDRTIVVSPASALDVVSELPPDTEVTLKRAYASGSHKTTAGQLVTAQYGWWGWAPN